MQDISKAAPAIAFGRPMSVGNELAYIAEAIASGRIAGGGAFTRRCESWLEKSMPADRVLLTHSCTGALEMAAILSGAGPGDEIIMPSFTFSSTATAFVLRGAIPVFVDIYPETFNMNETLLEEAITPRTRAIVPVHYAGVTCDMLTILQIAQKFDLMVIEDAAQAHFSTWRGRSLGTLGQLGCLSFHETKTSSPAKGVR